MFCDLGTPEEILSIVATHVLYTKYMYYFDDEGSSREEREQYIQTYANSITLSGLPIISAIMIDHRCQRRKYQTRIPLRTVREFLYSRIALEFTLRSLLKDLYPYLLPSALKSTVSSQFWQLRLQVLVPDEENEDPFIEINEDGFVADGFPNDDMAKTAREIFKEHLKLFIANPDSEPETYRASVLNTIYNFIVTGDNENDFRIRFYLKTGRNISFDSSAISLRGDAKRALEGAKQEWRKRKSQRWMFRSEQPKDNYSVYQMLSTILFQNNEILGNHNPLYDELWPYWERKMKRREAVRLLASSKPQRITMASMEKIWFQNFFEVGENFFEVGDSTHLSWIKRRRMVQIIESRTDYFVVMPIERRVVIWTTHSLYNSFQFPWRSLVRSHMWPGHCKTP